ncbi:MAG: tetraacyldisaccharide 4'-kinase [Kangiellaceae bacterium]|nr:tetraacyldisaccharide 4'-kinase [Kangiellaceae bacterium]
MAISKSQQFFENLWYRPTVWWLWLLLPLQLLLRVIVWLRRKFYQWGIFKSYKPAVPVVVIGNINVGGTGKTPLAIYLIKLLSKQGLKVGLVTRGYGGESAHYPLLMTEQVKPQECGDEPFLIYNHTAATIVVDPNRSRGAEKLAELGCDLVLCDDGLQHYKLQRDLEIVVIDGQRQFGNGWLMPFGPLREPVSRLNSADIQVVNGQSMQLIAKSITQMNDWQPVSLDTQAIIQKNCHAVAAIGNPQRFYSTLARLGFNFSQHSFPDHHQFTADDIERIRQNQSLPIVMTEKDAVKCREFDVDDLYFLPVEAQLDKELEVQILHSIESITRHIA